MNKKKIIGIIAVVIAVISIGSVFFDEKNFNNLPIEEKLLYGKNYDEESPDKTMLCWFEVDDGYIHVDKSDEDVVSIYHTSEDFSTVVAVCDFTEENMNRDNYTVPLDTQLLSSGRYVNCYEHKENLKVIADGKELDIHTFVFEGKNDTYKMDLWYIKADELPEITIEKE